MSEVLSTSAATQTPSIPDSVDSPAATPGLTEPKPEARSWVTVRRTTTPVAVMNFVSSAIAERCIGKPAALAKAYFSAANASEKSWGDRIWNGIKGVGHGALAALGGLATLTIGLLLAAPVIIIGAVAGGVIGGMAGSFGGPFGTAVGMVAGASAGATLVTYTVLRDVSAGAQDGYRWYQLVHASRSGTAVSPPSLDLAAA